MHRLDSIHHHRVDCNEARGAALTKMVETDDNMDHSLKDVYVGRMMYHGQVLWSRHDACVPD